MRMNPTDILRDEPRRVREVYDNADVRGYCRHYEYLCKIHPTVKNEWCVRVHRKDDEIRRVRLSARCGAAKSKMACSAEYHEKKRDCAEKIRESAARHMRRTDPAPQCAVTTPMFTFDTLIYDYLPR